MPTDYELSWQAEGLTYGWVPGNLVTQELLEECSLLYSAHYGEWSAAAGQRAGKRIGLSPERIREWFASGQSDLFLARCDETLIGYAIALRATVADKGQVGWVTQLVVHDGYRERGVAKTLLSTNWTISSFYAWGIVTASPFAVRALEKATRRRCRPLRIIKDQFALADEGAKHLPYLDSDSYVVVQTDKSIVYTDFFVDHSTVGDMLGSVTSAAVPWRLGTLDEGWEWFAFTFQDQGQISLTRKEIDEILLKSDQITLQAYGRMQLSTSHGWLKHTVYEANQAIELMGLQDGATVIDIGCGMGRHAIALAGFGMRVTGVDYVLSNIQAARDAADGRQDVEFVLGDCREIDLAPADAVICLYDVVGSFAEPDENTRLLANASRHVKTGGMLLLSVMNYEMTEALARHRFVLSDDPNVLLGLVASRAMETTGEVFDPDHYLVDTSTQVVYRKEQFFMGDDLPVEWIVRDRRYRRDEIVALCGDVGLEVLWARFVHAGDWATDLDPTDPAAKEILVLCRKLDVC